MAHASTVLTFLLIAFLVAVHVAWWGFKAYVPSAALCGIVHRDQHKWLARALACFTRPAMSTPGFVAALFWPAIVLLNLLLLAQVMELFFPGGGRMDLGMFGSYSVFALVAGTLFSASQTLFGLVHGESRSRTTRVLFFFLLLGTIFVEGWLAYYRTVLITSGEEQMTGTVVDQTMASVGPALAGAVGVFVPISHTVAGYVAFPGFLLPAISYSLRCLGGIALLAWSTITYLFFGFHNARPVDVPRWLFDIRKESQDLLESSAKLRACSSSLRNGLRTLRNADQELGRVSTLDDLEGRAKTLTEQKAGLETTWASKGKQFRERATRPDLGSFYELLDDMASVHDSILDEAKRLVGTVDPLVREVDGLGKRPKMFTEREQQRSNVETLLQQGRVHRQEVQERSSMLQRKQHEILGIWSGQITAATTLPGLESKIEQLRSGPAMLPADSGERQEASAVFELCHSVVSKEGPDALASVRSCSTEFEQMEQDAVAVLEQPGLTAPRSTSGRLAELAQQLAGIESIIKVARRLSRDLEGLKKHVAALCRELERKPAWLYFLKDLIGLTSTRS